DAKTDARGLPKVREREIPHGIEDVPNIDEDHAIEDTDERHSQLVVDHQHGLAADGDAIRTDRTDSVLREATERGAAAGKEPLAPRHRQVANAPSQTNTNSSCIDEARPDDFVRECPPRQIRRA